MTPDATILQPLVTVLNAVLKFFHENVGLSWGMSIIALTICTRAILIPLTYKQLKGMRAMQALQPQIKEIQAKYKNDKQRMQQEMMNFYKEHKVNPFASCVPLIAQLPVFFTLYYVLEHNLQGDIGCPTAGCVGGQASFLFIPDLTQKATGGVLIALLILYVVTQLISGLVMSITADKSQRMMMFLMPLIFVPFILRFPSGLMVYWISTNIWTIGQQYAIQKIIPAPHVPTAEEARAAKPPPPPPKKKRKRR